ncbi:hypothetical protein [Streptomyces sp. NPDC002520]
MAPTLDPLTVQRLAYIRYLHREGIEQSRQPPPLRSRAITSFHDAVENYLGLVAQHLGIELARNTEFMAYWAAIKPKFELPKKEQMRRLNDVRVSLKHNGTFPSGHHIEQARETLADFFTTVTPRVFGVHFDTIDMVDLLTQPEVAQLLRDAQTHADIGDYTQAVAGLSLSIDALVDHYAVREFGGTGSPFSFGPNIAWHDDPKLDGRSAPRDGRLAKLTAIAESAQHALRAISIGIDYASLARFKIIAPRVIQYLDGGQSYVVAEYHEALTADDYDWARHFVIESALRAAGADGIEQLRQDRLESGRRRTETLPERSWTGPARPAADA